MKAIVQDRYGSLDVLRLAEVDKPVVGADEVLVRVRAASVHADVWHVVSGLPYVLRLMGSGLSKPKNPIPGTDMAGIVEAVGSNATQFKPGDEVFGETHRGLLWTNGGAYAEYVAVPEDVLALKPANISFEQAASVPTSGMIALHNLQNVRPAQAGSQGAGQRRRRWRGHNRSTAGKGLRRKRDRCGQRTEAGHAPSTSAQTTVLTTRRRTSPKAANATISSSTSHPTCASPTANASSRPRASTW